MIFMSPFKAYRSLTVGAKNLVRLGAVAIMSSFALVVVSLVLAATASSKADDAKAYAQATCPLVLSIVRAPLPPQPTDFSIALLAGMRNTYEDAHCFEVTGVLPAADERIVIKQAELRRR